jgi:hypothetical protein
MAITIVPLHFILWMARTSARLTLCRYASAVKQFTPYGQMMHPKGGKAQRNCGARRQRWVESLHAYPPGRSVRLVTDIPDSGFGTRLNFANYVRQDDWFRF